MNNTFKNTIPYRLPHPFPDSFPYKGWSIQPVPQNNKMVFYIDNGAGHKNPTELKFSSFQKAIKHIDELTKEE